MDNYKFGVLAGNGVEKRVRGFTEKTYSQLNNLKKSTERRKVEKTTKREPRSKIPIKRVK